ncbi:MAG: hypothetical protein KC621_00335 [Myxococcales bacterium]|nr:hypothetical protein [Myxococcales bacterium]
MFLFALLSTTSSAAEPASTPTTEPASPVDHAGPPQPPALAVLEISATWSAEDELWAAPLTLRLGTPGKRTVEFQQEIADKRALVWSTEVDVPAGGQLTETLELEPLVGFNGGRTYWVVVRPGAGEPPLGEARLTLTKP